MVLYKTYKIQSSPVEIVLQRSRKCITARTGTCGDRHPVLCYLLLPLGETLRNGGRESKNRDGAVPSIPRVGNDRSMRGGTFESLSFFRVVVKSNQRYSRVRFTTASARALAKLFIRMAKLIRDCGTMVSSMAVAKSSA